jgi:hypothetical protein
MRLIDVVCSTWNRPRAMAIASDQQRDAHQGAGLGMGDQLVDGRLEHLGQAGAQGRRSIAALSDRHHQPFAARPEDTRARSARRGRG